MNKNIGIAVGILVIIVLVIFAVDKSPKSEEVLQVAGVGSYEAYAPEKIAKAENGKVVLFFRASWCPTCKVADANIRANLASIPADVTILDVNYDQANDLKQKYGVTYQHTFVQVDKDANLLTKWSGSMTLNAILANIK
jgi:thioredoxin 1